MITSKNIRSRLKQWDAWRNKVSKTMAILDREYDTISVDDISVIVPIVMKRMSENGMVYGGEVRDCDNFAIVFNTFFYLEWIKTHSLEPAIFRCVINTGSGIHAISIMFAENTIYFLEPQNGRYWSIKEFNPQILAVT